MFSHQLDRSAIPLGVRLYPACNPSLHELEKGMIARASMSILPPRIGSPFAFCLDDAKSAILNPTSQAIVEAFEFI
jgi:hypothetical protein